MKKKLLLSASALLLPFASLITISCFNNSPKYQVIGSALGKTINQTLFSFMGYPNHDNYGINNTIDEAIEKIENVKSDVYTITTGKVMPQQGNAWNNKQIRTMTIAKDKIVLLANLPDNIVKSQSKITINEQKLSDFYGDATLPMSWETLLAQDSSSMNLLPNQMSTQLQLMGRFNHEKSAGTAKTFFKYLETHNKFVRKNDLQRQNLFYDDINLFKAIKKTPGSLTYIANSQAQMLLDKLQANDKKNLLVIELTKQKELTIPINFLYQVSDEFNKNLGMFLINQIFSPQFQTILQKKLFFYKLSGEEIMWQTNDQTANKNVNMETTDEQINTQNNPHLKFGLIKIVL